MWGVCLHVEARDQHGGLPHCGGVAACWSGVYI